MEGDWLFQLLPANRESIPAASFSLSLSISLSSFLLMINGWNPRQEGKEKRTMPREAKQPKNGKDGKRRGTTGSKASFPSLSFSLASSVSFSFLLSRVSFGLNDSREPGERERESPIDPPLPFSFTSLFSLPLCLFHAPLPLLSLSPDYRTQSMDSWCSYQIKNCRTKFPPLFWLPSCDPLSWLMNEWTNERREKSKEQMIK